MSVSITFNFIMSDVILKVRSGAFRLILSFLHLVYSVLQYFDIAWALFKRKLDNELMYKFTDSRSYVSRFVTGLDKCPSHFAIITGTEKVNYEDFSNLVVWCIAAGISFISFYDFTGYLKDNKDLYFNYLISEKKLDPNYVILNKEISNCAKNGFKKNGVTKKIHVNILSREDGRGLFCEAVGNLCERTLANELKDGDIDERCLDDEVCKVVGFNEPELAIVCGSVCSTFGFLPWHIRLTEFLQISSIEKISVSDFTSILKRYSHCHQRFGK